MSDGFADLISRLRDLLPHSSLNLHGYVSFPPSPSLPLLMSADEEVIQMRGKSDAFLYLMEEKREIFFLRQRSGEKDRIKRTSKGGRQN